MLEINLNLGIFSQKVHEIDISESVCYWIDWVLLGQSDQIKLQHQPQLFLSIRNQSTLVGEVVVWSDHYDHIEASLPTGNWGLF